MNVFLAFDESESALSACRLVAAYAGNRPTLRVTLVNVQRPPLRLSPQPMVPQHALEAALHEKGERQLEPALRLLQEAGFAPGVVVRIGPPADTLLAALRDGAADVLVMGSGRQGMLSGYAMGSVALRVAPAAHCPVVLVRPDATLPAQLGTRTRVTAPVDGSPEAGQAIKRLVACAGFLGEMHVDLVHFRPGLSLAAAMMPPHDDVLQQWSGQASEAALAAAAQVLSAAGIAHEKHSQVGAPEAGIAAFAKAQGADLIAMGSRGLGTMHHLVLGSVALRTAHLSDVPVALLR